MSEKSSDTIYLLGSFRPFERTNPLDSETSTGFGGEVMLLGYDDDVEKYPDLTIYKINKNILIESIENAEVSNYTNVNLKDSYIKKHILKNIFSDVIYSKNKFDDETKYNNKISIVINNKFFTFYDFYTTDNESIEEIANLLKDELILNIKAQHLIKKYISESSINIKKMFKGFKPSSMITRRNLIKKAMDNGGLKELRDSYVRLFDETKQSFKTDIKISMVDKYLIVDEPVNLILNENVFIYPKNKYFYSQFNIKESNISEKSIIVLYNPKVSKYYDHKTNKIIVKICGVLNIDDAECEITIDFKYIKSNNDNKTFDFYDFWLFTERNDSLLLN